MQTQQEKPTEAPGLSDVLGPCAFEFTSSNTGSWRLKRPRVNFAACIRCGTCKMYCPTGVITVEKGGSEPVRFLWDYCKGCGICANECPKHCIEMVDEGSAE